MVVWLAVGSVDVAGVAAVLVELTEVVVTMAVVNVVVSKRSGAVGFEVAMVA